MDPSEDLLQLSVETIAKQLAIEDYIPVRHVRVATSQSTGQMSAVENVGITTLQPSYTQAVSKKDETEATQPLFRERVANQLEDIYQVGNGGVFTSQSADQMNNVANIGIAAELRSVENVEIVTSPSEKSNITESAEDPPTSSTRNLGIGTTQYEDEMNAKNRRDLAILESKGASLAKKQKMRKSRNRKENKRNGGGKVPSTLTAQKKSEKQQEGHDSLNIGNAGFASSQPADQMNAKNLRVVTLQSEGRVTEENAEILAPHSEKPGIIEPELENSPINSSTRNLEIEMSFLSNNIYSTIAHLKDEMNAENQDHNATSESKDESALLKRKPRRKNPNYYKKKTKKIGNGEGSTGVNVSSNRCCSKRNIALLTILMCILWLAPFVKGGHRGPRGSLWQILAAITVALI